MTSIIQTALQEANAAPFFQSNAIQVGTTKDYQQVISTLAEWQYNDWHSYNASYTLEKLQECFQKQLESESLPFSLVAMKDGTPIASIGLEEQAEPELADLPGPWPGSFHVVPDERGRGLE